MWDVLTCQEKILLLGENVDKSLWLMHHCWRLSSSPSKHNKQVRKRASWWVPRCISTKSIISSVWEREEKQGRAPSPLHVDCKLYHPQSNMVGLVLSKSLSSSCKMRSSMQWVGIFSAGTSVLMMRQKRNVLGTRKDTVRVCCNSESHQVKYNQVRSKDPPMGTHWEGKELFIWFFISVPSGLATLSSSSFRSALFKFIF